jgi:CHAT domain
MGGLVSRCMIWLHPELWRAMQDPSGAAAGGRLVMLGKPNQGSYSIPLALCGQEKLVKALEICDLRYDLPTLLRVLSSFPGSCQMLPSPLVDLGDQHDRLYDAASWGKLPIQAALLQKAERFHTQLRDVVNPERLVYVGGYDRETPFLIRVDRPGEFWFQMTFEGDGRVPHALGLLPDVPTFWVDEGHGDLPRNERVLDGIHEFLARGQTDAGGRRVERARSETALLPSLADELVRLGVRNYVGTAWEVNDVGAVEFAKAFYESLLATDAAERTMGEAMRVGRQALFARSRSFGKLWAAYQHYGDPVAKLV